MPKNLSKLVEVETTKSYRIIEYINIKNLRKLRLTSEFRSNISNFNQFWYSIRHKY